MTKQGQTLEAAMGTLPRAGEIQIRPLATARDATAFRTLNEEWITHSFVLEERDREILCDPYGKILRIGGHVFVVQRGEEIIGCVALIPTGDGRYELSKMAVSPQMRGLGVGRRLLLYAIEQGKALGARSLWLGSSTRLPNAVHLYESVGFRHVPVESLPAPRYARGDVFMERLL